MTNPLSLPKLLEKDIQKYFQDILTAYGILHWRYSVTALRHTSGGKEFFRKNPLAGFPDECGLTPKGRFWAYEIKGPEGKLSENQELWLTKLKKAGAVTGIIKSLEDAREALHQILAL